MNRAATWCFLVLLLCSGVAHASLRIAVDVPIAPSMDRPVQVSVSLENGGSQTISLPNGSAWHQKTGLVLTVTQINGPSRKMLDDAEPEKSSVVLRPGHAMDLGRTLDADKVFFAGAGDYLLTVTYTGPNQTVESTPFRVSAR